MHLGTRPNNVVPITLEVIAFYVQLAEFLGRDLLADRIAATIEASANEEPAAVGRVSNQVDDRLIGTQGTAAPVHRDEGKQAVLNLVPFAGAGWKVADKNRNVELVG